MMSSIFALWTGLALGLGGPVTGLAISPEAEQTRVVISVDGDVQYRDFTMEGPSRLVVDVFGARHALPRDNYLDIHRGGVRSVRTSQYSADVVRVVLELEQTVPYEIVPEEGRIRISLFSEAAPFEPWETGGSVRVPAASGEADVPETADREPPAGTTADEGAAQRSLEPLPQQPQARRITVNFPNTPVGEVLQTFADFSGRSIVAGQNVTGAITATIDDQPWDQALRTILEVNGFRALELENGIIRVDNVENLSTLEQVEPVSSRVYKVNYATAQEIQNALQGLVTERGAVEAAQGSNAVIVTDIQRVHDMVGQLIADLDRRTPQVTIQAKIIFVNRTDLNEFGITYDLKDSAGNQLNVVTPGAVDEDGDGVIELPDEEVPIGENVVSLGGSSVAALGNANQRVVAPALTLLNSLIVGRHTLITFVEALRSVNLSDIQAAPLVRVADNNEAEIQVGERTPLRVVDAQAAGGAGPGGLPQANVQIEETGVILRATPHITANNDILLELHAERSAPQLAESDAGFIFTTQQAQTRVLVRDGQTVVIGGLTVTETNSVQSGIPLLMDLPVLGKLFRVTRESQIQRDLIILVTPHIVQDEL
ncbi:MAG: AMIN domain-containing protein [Gemmatimonadota bacterium]|jgi:type IV pilus assembly protein PilQ